jgi:hypothetical protein
LRDMVRKTGDDDAVEMSHARKLGEGMGLVSNKSIFCPPTS